MRSSRRNVIFAKRLGSSKVKGLSMRVEQLNSSEDRLSSDENQMADSEVSAAMVPSYLRSAPLLKDSLATETSIAQDETVDECLPHLIGSDDPSQNPFDFNEHGVPHLDREAHIQFLTDALEEFPAQFVGVDTSRPWMVYWALLGLYLLGEDLRPFRSRYTRTHMRASAEEFTKGVQTLLTKSNRVVKTFISMQNPSGGIGGGQGQLSHLAGSYAAILSLALVGGLEAYTLINREEMWNWLGRLKQPDGGFQVCEGGEEDVRGAYCALVIVSLLNLPFELPSTAAARAAGLSTLGDGVGEYLSRCQTYEGGISAAPGGEAHGAYAFCAIACLCLLDQPHLAMKSYLDLDALLSWLSSRQYAPEGGFAGRTNKLVDGCYSHWLGGCWPLVQAALDGPRSTADMASSATVGSLFSRQGLARYILGCCQAKTGGLRDKPSKRPDSYHTCYCLAGLSMVQHLYYFEKPETANQFASVATWKSLDSDQLINPENTPNLFDEADRLRSMHPVYVIPERQVRMMREWAQGLDAPWLE